MRIIQSNFDSLCVSRYLCGGVLGSFPQGLLLSRLFAYAELPQPVAAAHDVHVDVARLMEVPRLLIFPLAVEDLLDPPHTCDRVLTRLLEGLDEVRVVVSGHFVDVVVFLAAQAFLVES